MRAGLPLRGLLWQLLRRFWRSFEEGACVVGLCGRLLCIFAFCLACALFWFGGVELVHLCGVKDFLCYNTA